MISQNTDLSSWDILYKPFLTVSEALAEFVSCIYYLCLFNDTQTIAANGLDNQRKINWKARQEKRP
jgi:hypothetical protein